MNYKELYKTIYKALDVEKVLDSYDIFYSSYSGSNGTELMFRCPFPDHDDLSPSFSLNKSTGIWNCFVCGGGDFFRFIKIIEGFKSTREAIDLLKSKVGFIDNFRVDFETLEKMLKDFGCSESDPNVSDTEPDLKEISLPNCVSADKYYEIVKKRVSLEDIKKWNLKYCIEPANKYEMKYKDRLIIPVYFKNKLVTFAARDMSGNSDKWAEMKKTIRRENHTREEINELIKKYECKKFLYPFGSPLSFIFFNWDEAVKNKDYVIIVEGIFDAIKLIEYGYNAISILSCHLNRYRFNMLIENFKKVFVCLDNDDKINAKGIRENPGQEAAEKIVKSLSDIEVYNILLPANKDPDECSREEFKKFFDESQKKINKLFTWTNL
jgi:DNA primase